MGVAHVGGKSTISPRRSSALARGARGLALVVLLGAAPVAAEDWPQWRGPHRTGEAPDFEPPSSWPEQLQPQWRVEVGRGDSSPVVADGRVFVFSRRDGRETVTALRLADGELLWRQGYDAPFEPLPVVREHGAGPFSTPLVHDGRLFTLGIKETLSAWSVEEGRLIWQKTFTGDFKRTQPFYGASQAPIVVDGRLIVHLGGPGDGALMAFDPATGEELWRSRDDGPAYGSPVVVQVDGQSQLVTLTQRHLVGVEPTDGRVLWELPFQIGFDVTALTPLAVDDLLVVSGNQVPTRAWRLGEGGPSEVWSKPEVSMEFSSPVVAAGRILGFASQNKGQLVALEPTTGKVVWSGPPRSGDNAWLIAVGELVLATHDDGRLVVVSAAADEYRPLAEYRIADAAVWAHPALLQSRLVVKDVDSVQVWEIRPE